MQQRPMRHEERLAQIYQAIDDVCERITDIRRFVKITINEFEQVKTQEKAKAAEQATNNAQNQ